MNPIDAARKLDSFLQREWEYALREDPVFATQCGIDRYNHTLPDYSLEGVARKQQHEREARLELRAIERDLLEPADRLNYDLYASYLDTAIEGHAFPEHLMPVHQLDGIHSRGPQIHVYHSFLTLKDYEDYLSRIGLIPSAMEQTLQRMKAGLQQGITPPRIPMRTVREQIQAQIVDAPGKSPFYEPFTRFPETISVTDRERLLREAAGVISGSIVPAYRSFLAFWEDTYYPGARETTGASALPGGREWYEHCVRRETTTALAPERIHEMGVEEVRRIREAMKQVRNEAHFEGTYEEFVAHLKTDPQFFYSRTEDLVTAYRDICKRLDAEIPRFFKKLPRLPYGVREIPAFAAPSMPTGFYDYGSLEAGRPAWYYVNTYRLDMRPKWEMEVLSIHESVPGHHLQLSLAREMSDVPEFRKHFNHTAYVEGWGLYSESLGPEMGFYADPYSKFGWLSYDMWRAVRLVVDTGMHALGWSRDRAIQYFRDNSSKTEQDIVVEVDRYLVWPAQALAYKIGQMKMQELRRKQEQRLGSAFDLRDFHDRILAHGSLPLHLLEKLLD